MQMRSRISHSMQRVAPSGERCRCNNAARIGLPVREFGTFLASASAVRPHFTGRRRSVTYAAD
jgi:hypothetical protein